MCAREIWDTREIPERNERDSKISKNEGGTFSQNFTNKHVIPG